MIHPFAATVAGFHTLCGNVFVPLIGPGLWAANCTHGGDMVTWGLSLATRAFREQNVTRT